MRWIRALPAVVLIPFLTACPPPEEDVPPAREPTPAEPVEVQPPDVEMMVNRWTEAFHAGDYERVAQLYTTDARYVFPTGELHEGHEGIQSALEALPPSRIEVDIARSDAGDRYGYMSGSYVQEVEELDQPLEGHYLLVLQHDGEDWLILEHVSIMTPESQQRAAALLQQDEES